MVPNLYTLTLPKSAMDLVLGALVELPYRVSKPVIDEALKQFTEQEKDPTDPPNEAPA